MKSKARIQVAVLCPIQRDYLACETTKNREEYDFHYLDSEQITAGNVGEAFDIIAYIEFCKEYIEQHDIQVVLATHDIPAIIQAILCQQFKHLRGPSIESVLHCLHKFYTRAYLDPSPIRYTYVDLENFHTYSNVKSLGFPSFIKPAISATSLFVSMLKSYAEFEEKAAVLKEEFSQFRYFNVFADEYIDRAKYPLCFQNTALVEEYVQSPYKITMDGCVFNEQIIFWGLTDNIYFSSKPECFNACIYPSSLPEFIQENIRQSYSQIVHRLIDLGYDNQFVNVEFFVFEDGSLKVMEVNSRVFGQIRPIYVQCLEDGDQFAALIEICCGHRPKTPKPNGLFGGNFYVNTFADDITENLVNFEIADRHPEFTMNVSPGNYVCGSKRNQGFRLAYIDLVATTVEELYYQADELKRKFLKCPEASPWE